jgi:tetratricopeptide (TPR) repeat protein
MKRRLGEISLVIGALIVLAASLHGVEELSRKKNRSDVLYLPSGRFIEQATLGYHNLAADVLWFKMVQYYGGYRMGENDLALFSHLVDVITDLDPQFTYAYVFGALIIAEDLGNSATGITFLEKGIRSNPKDWWLEFELGFLYYIYARDYAQALFHFESAAKIPGAGPQAARFAAFVAGKAGNVETSIALWEELARTSDNKYIRELAGRYIEKLRSGTFPGMEKR